MNRIVLKIIPIVDLVNISFISLLHILDAIAPQSKADSRDFVQYIIRGIRSGLYASKMDPNVEYQGLSP